jgi:hypothetical protein
VASKWVEERCLTSSLVGLEVLLEPSKFLLQLRTSNWFVKASLSGSFGLGRFEIISFRNSVHGWRGRLLQ